MTGGVILLRQNAVPKYAPHPRPGETAWFRGDQQPVQIGVYRRLTLVHGVTAYSWFNGTTWFWHAATPAKAAGMTVPSLIQNLPWCGLVNPPAEGYGPMVGRAPELREVAA